MAKDRFQQAMLIGIGLMVAIGFSGVFTYGPLINSGDSSNSDNDNQEINASLPEKNFIDGSYNLSNREQYYLSANNQVVFVNALYKNDKSNISQLKNIPSSFDNKVYINSINVSKSQFSTSFQTNPPSAVVIGDEPTRTRRGTLPYSIGESQITKKAVISTICDTKRDTTNYGAVCYGS